MSPLSHTHNLTGQHGGLLGERSIAPITQARGLVQLFLTRLDTARSHTEDLSAAFQVEDAHRALVIIGRLQRALSDAYLTVVVLEQLSGCLEPSARAALGRAQHEARLPRILARILTSQLRNEHYQG